MFFHSDISYTIISSCFVVTYVNPSVSNPGVSNLVNVLSSASHIPFESII